MPHITPRVQQYGLPHRGDSGCTRCPYAAALAYMEGQVRRGRALWQMLNIDVQLTGAEIAELCFCIVGAFKVISMVTRNVCM